MLPDNRIPIRPLAGLQPGKIGIEKLQSVFVERRIGHFSARCSELQALRSRKRLQSVDTSVRRVDAAAKRPIPKDR